MNKVSGFQHHGKFPREPPFAANNYIRKSFYTTLLHQLSMPGCVYAGTTHALIEKTWCGAKRQGVVPRGVPEGRFLQDRPDQLVCGIETVC